MKTFFIWLMVGLTVSMNLTAQRGGGGGGRGGAGGGGGAPMGGNIPGGMRGQQAPSRDYEQVQITDFPEIMGLTVNQKLNLFKIVKDEYKNILKLTDQKQELQRTSANAKNQKEIDKNTKALEKLDGNAKKVSETADKKIRKIISNDQYREFTEKRELVKFKDPPLQRGRFRNQ